jgi:ribosomal protein S18 acetylase RimI-like enzyme
VPRAAVEVRSAGVDDAALLLLLAASARSETGRAARPEPGHHRDRLVTALRRPDVEVLVAEVGREPVGLLVLRMGELVPLSSSPACHVEQLYVRPDWRRRGVARQLLLAAATRGEQQGLGDVVCTVSPSGREAHRFLARLGFVPLVSHRVIPVSTLVRRLTGERSARRPRSGVQQLLARRRRELKGRGQDPSPVGAVGAGN